MMEKYIPKVSVIIPVYNAGRYLGECLESVVNQTLKEIEIICVNDGSDDGSLEILQEYAARDPRIHVINQKHSNAGVARNNGLKNASGEYLAFLDADDFFELNMLESAYTLAVHEAAEVVEWRIDRYFTDTQSYEPYRFGIRLHRFPDHIPFAGLEVKKNPFTAFAPCAWDKLFSRQFVTQNNLWFQEQRTRNDLLFVYSAMIKAKRIVIIDQIFAHWRKNHQISLTSSTEISNSWDCFYQALKALKKQLIDWGIFTQVEQGYVNLCLRYSLWTLHGCSGRSQKLLYETLKTSWFNEFGITKSDESYFYKNGEFLNYCRIMAMDYEQYIRSMRDRMLRNERDAQG